jgi:hypothetical protein
VRDHCRAAKAQSSCAAVAMTGQRRYNAPRVSSVTLPDSRQMTNIKIKLDDGYDYWRRDAMTVEGGIFLFLGLLFILPALYWLSRLVNWVAGRKLIPLWLLAALL